MFERSPTPQGALGRKGPGVGASDPAKLKVVKLAGACGRAKQECGRGESTSRAQRNVRCLQGASGRIVKWRNATLLVVVVSVKCVLSCIPVSKMHWHCCILHWLRCTILHWLRCTGGGPALEAVHGRRPLAKRQPTNRQALRQTATKRHRHQTVNPTNCGPKTDGHKLDSIAETRRRPRQRARVGAVHDIRSHERPWQLPDDHRKARSMLLGAGP